MLVPKGLGEGADCAAVFSGPGDEGDPPVGGPKVEAHASCCSVASVPQPAMGDLGVHEGVAVFSDFDARPIDPDDVVLRQFLSDPLDDEPADGDRREDQCE